MTTDTFAELFERIRNDKAFNEACARLPSIYKRAAPIPPPAANGSGGSDAAEAGKDGDDGSSG